MQIPERVNGKWMATLDNTAILEAETILYADFRKEDTKEKARTGARYRMLEGPASLMDAWVRWSAVRNEAGRRGLATHRRA